MFPPAATSSSESADRPATRLATRLSFLVAGFACACWAPLVPLAKQRLGIDEGGLGLLLLCIGIGSILAMLITGPLTSRLGSRPVICASGFLLAAILPLLVVASTPLTLGAALLLFGAAMGSLDVAMNVHAVEVERAATRPLMSGFHAMFSVGGFLGSGLITLLIGADMRPLVATLIAAALAIATMVIVAPRLLRAVSTQRGPMFAMPHGSVLALAALAAVMFLVEGAMLDWGALLITETGRTTAGRAGLGYVLFAVAMTIGRLTGDAIIARIGERTTLLAGSGIAISGFVVLLIAPWSPVALSGFVLIGLGASNLVPIFFRRAGAQTVMPTGLAIAAVTTTGYAGILLGPVAIGFIAHAASLTAAFWMLAALVALVPLGATFLTRPQHLARRA